MKSKEELLEKIKSVVVNIDDKDYIRIKKDTLKKLGYHYNIFTKKWKRTKFDDMVSSLEFKVVKKDKNTYLVGVDLDKLTEPFVYHFVVPYIVELIEVGE